MKLIISLAPSTSSPLPIRSAATITMIFFAPLNSAVAADFGSEVNPPPVPMTVYRSPACSTRVR